MFENFFRPASVRARDGAQNHAIQSPEINTVYQGYTVRPRTIGVSLKAHF